MFKKTLYLKTSETLELIKKESFLEQFYLAGGTSLALQIGHRKSIDLDFFSKEKINVNKLLHELKTFKPTVIQQDEDTLDIEINDTKVSFFRYKYPLINKLKHWNNIKLASINDIACMKLVAIGQRGTKKDFVDMYTILKDHLTFEELLNMFDKKYKDIKYSKTHFLKSLNYFTEAELDAEPDYIKNIEWEKVKKFFNKLSTNYLIDN